MIESYNYFQVLNFDYNTKVAAESLKNFYNYLYLYITV